MDQEQADKYMQIFPEVRNLVIKPSTRVGKRFRAEFIMDGKKQTVFFGQPGAVTYFDSPNEAKRNGFRSRASKIKDKAGEYTYNKPGTANSFSYNLLW